MPMDSKKEASKKKKMEPAKQEVRENKEQEYLEGWQRAKADYMNLKKEMEDERQKSMMYAKMLLLADLLPIINNYQRATQGLSENEEAKSNTWAQGFIHIAKLFDGFLQQTGIERIATTGEPFDPALHDAIEQEEAQGVAPGTIIKEIEPGYKLNESVIAAAKVIVAK